MVTELNQDQTKLIKVETVVENWMVNRLIRTLMNEMCSLHDDDTRLFTFDTIDCVRIRTNERGTEAIS